MTRLGDRMLFRDRVGAPERAAIVAHVLADGLVNLTIFEADGATRHETRVPVLGAESLPPSGNFCRTREDD